MDKTPDHYVLSITLGSDTSTFIVPDKQTHDFYRRRADELAARHPAIQMQVYGYPVYIDNEVQSLTDYLVDISLRAYTPSRPDASKESK